jgi:hypothetical protein
MTIDRNRQIICVVGAPRSGTTSLSAFLMDHPEVAFSAVKEPHFFSRFDLSGLSWPSLRQRIEDEYLARYFPGDADDGRVFAEGSVTYLYAPERMEAILRVWPEAKFVIAVRDPLEMLPSLHLRLLYNGDETERDLEAAWSLAPLRRQGRKVPASCIDARWLQYDEIVQLGKHVDRFVAAVGRERCFVSVFDDLVADAEGVYRRLLDFLDLPYHARRDFAPQRQSLGYRSGCLQRLLKRPPLLARGVLAGEKLRQHVKPVGSSDDPWMKLVFAARRRLLDWNTTPTAPKAMSAGFRVRLREQLRDDVARLSRVIDRDLDHWLAPEPSVAVRRRPARSLATRDVEIA